MLNPKEQNTMCEARVNEVSTIVRNTKYDRHVYDTESKIYNFYNIFGVKSLY